MAYEAFGFVLDDSGYPAHHRAAKDAWLNSKADPPPLHSWCEYHRAKEWLRLMDKIISCQKQTPEQTKEWQELTIRVAAFEDQAFNHL